MANTPILSLPVASFLDGTESMIVVQGGVDKRIAAQKVAQTLLNTVPGAIEYVLDGGNIVLNPGMKGFIAVPFNATITSVSVFGDRIGSTAVDIWKCSFAQFDGFLTHPSVADSIVGLNPPVISAGTKYQNMTLSGWTIGLTNGDILAFSVGSTIAFQKLTVVLNVSRILQ